MMALISQILQAFDFNGCRFWSGLAGVDAMHQIYVGGTHVFVTMLVMLIGFSCRMHEVFMMKAVSARCLRALPRMWVE